MSADFRFGPPLFGAKLLTVLGFACFSVGFGRHGSESRRPAGGFPSKRGTGDVLGSTLVSVSLLRCGSSGFDRVPETLLPMHRSPWPYLD